MPLKDTGTAPSSQRGAAEDARTAVKELQSLKTAVVAGAAAAANIAVAGLDADDVLVGVVRFDLAVDTGTSATGNKVQAVSDLTSEATVHSSGNLRLSTTDTTGDSLLVLFFQSISGS